MASTWKYDSDLPHAAKQTAASLAARRVVGDIVRIEQRAPRWLCGMFARGYTIDEAVDWWNEQERFHARFRRQLARERSAAKQPPA